MALSLGGTIESLQSTMTMSEYYTWLAYRKKYGSLGPVRKYDLGPAIVATQINAANGGKSKLHDFMPYAPKPEEPVMSDEQILAAIELGGRIGR